MSAALVAAIVQARMGSTRLPGKVLMELAGRPLLWHVLERARRVPGIDRLIVATTRQPADDAIEAFCRAEGCACHRGSEDDVLDRYHGAAQEAGATVVVRITADCPLLDPEVSGRVVEALDRNGCDYASNTLEQTFPDGLDTEAFTAAALDKAWREARLASQREHVTPYLWQNGGLFTLCAVKQARDLSALRWTVDRPEDLAFVRAIYGHLHRPGSVFHMDAILALLERHPELERINQGIRRNEGYEKSLRTDHIVASPAQGDRGRDGT